MPVQAELVHFALSPSPKNAFEKKVWVIAQLFLLPSCSLPDALSPPASAFLSLDEEFHASITLAETIQFGPSR